MANADPSRAPSHQQELSADDDAALTIRQRIGAIFTLARLSFAAAPLAVILTVVGAILDAVLPIVTTYFAARTTTALAGVVAGKPDALTPVFVFIALTTAVGLLMVVWSSISYYIQQKLIFLVEARISDQMFQKFGSLKFWRYEDKATADLYDRAARFAREFAQSFQKVAAVVGAFIALVAALIALVWVNIWLALAVFLAVLPGMWLQVRLTRAQWEHWNESVGVRRRKSGIEQRMLHPKAIIELRMYSLVPHLLALRSRLRDRDERERLDQERSYILKRLAADLVEAATEAAALVWVTLRIAAGAMPLGQFVFVQQVVRSALDSANTLVTTFADVDQDLANLFDYQRFMATDDGESPTDVVPADAAVTVEDVSFRYPGEGRPRVLNGINVRIESGCNVALVGENGAGKSTLAKLLLGIYPPEQGRVLVGECDLADADLATWHRQIAVLTQDYLRFSFATIRENVAWGAPDRPVDDAAVWRALESAEAAAFVRGLPQGLDTFVDPWLTDDDGGLGTDLSGGQWQRLALARAFYRDAKVIVLDEPTSAIDALAETKIFDRLFAQRDRTIITISHRLTSIARADVIHVLVDGRIVESGTHAELVARGGEYVRIFASQLRPGGERN